MKSQELVSMFLSRADEFGTVGLTKKQAAWLLGLIARDGNRQHGPVFTVRDESGTYYKFVVYPNGAGFIKPSV